MNIIVEPNKPIAKQWMAYLVALMYIVVPILVCIGFRSGFNAFYITAITVQIILILIFKFCFAWYKSYSVTKYTSYIEVVNTDILNSLGNNKDKYKIKSISSYKLRGTNCKIFGDIEVKEPLSKPKKIKSMILYDITDELFDLVKENC